MVRAIQPARLVLVAVALIGLSACGAAKAARETGQMFDKYGCMSKEIKGGEPCPPSGS